VVFKATAMDPADRFQTARELSDAIERYLDGDRDLARRRELAAVHSTAAAKAAERALADEGASAMEQRSVAMSEISRALALDPQNTQAVETLVRLATQAPKQVPPEVKAELDERHVRDARGVQVSIARSFGAWLLLTPLLLVMGVRSYPLLALGMTLIASAGLLATYYGRFAKADPRPRWPLIALGATTIAFSATLFGPFVMAPGFAIQTMLTTSLAPGARKFGGQVVLPLLAVLGPAALQAAGLLPPSYAFDGDAIRILPHLASFPPALTHTFLFGSTAVLLLLCASTTMPLRQALTRAETHLAVQAWQLKQLIPREAQAAATFTAAAESDRACKVF
jgi:eukaryotic-like serine/threonine-protein kinase